MAVYLNQKNDKFQKYLKNQIFVDKSLIISECNRVFGSEDSYMCVTRPRRFGKTLALSMLNAYYSKGCDSRELFKSLAISKDPSFEEHLNKHNVIWVDMAAVYTGTRDKPLFVDKLQSEIVNDLKKAYPNILTSAEVTVREAITKINGETGERFVFLFDEWDVVYREKERSGELCEKYTEFLRSLFKSSDASACLDLVYMTGILPIRRYDTQSTLNMFAEYNMLEPRGIASLFGFTEDEVKGLCESRHADFAEIKNWYDGYRLGGVEIYNPKSVVDALALGHCGDYWVTTSATEAVTEYMNFDKGALKATIARMLAGEKAELDVGEFGNDLTKVDSQDAALCVLIHLGYLAYDPKGKSCYIPNHEVAIEFKRALKKLKWRQVFLPMGDSDKLLDATLKGDLAFIDETMDRNHEDLATVFSKNKEDVLGVVVYLSYFSAREHYEVKKEEGSAHGRSDLSFFPFEQGYPPFIVELKAGKGPEEAIAQIREREYWKAWGSYKGAVLLVGIGYDPKTLKHSSKVEWAEAQ